MLNKNKTNKKGGKKTKVNRVEENTAVQKNIEENILKQKSGAAVDVESEREEGKVFLIEKIYISYKCLNTYFKTTESEEDDQLLGVYYLEEEGKIFLIKKLIV